MKITLIASENTVIPTLSCSADEIVVRISISSSYDDIFELGRNDLTDDQLVELYRLWGDDYYPRNFLTLGEEIHITSRN